MNAQAPRRGLGWPRFFATAGFLILCGLGTWQLDRKAWKEELIETLRQRAAAEPVALIARTKPNPMTDEFRRVAFRATFENSQEAFVYTVGSSLRPDVTQPGYWIFTPAKLPDGSVLVVNRGFVPQSRQDPRTRPEGQVEDAIEIVGVMRWPEQRGISHRKTTQRAMSGICAIIASSRPPRNGARWGHFSSIRKRRSLLAAFRGPARRRCNCAMNICSMRSPGTGSQWSSSWCLRFGRGAADERQKLTPETGRSAPRVTFPCLPPIHRLRWMESLYFVTDQEALLNQ